MLTIQAHMYNHYSAKKTSGSLRAEFFPAKAFPAIAYIGP